MKKQDVVDMLRELAVLTTLDEGDVQSFRVRAYESAAQALDGFSGDPASLSAKQLEALPGIGKSTAAKIRELAERGRVEKLEALRAKYPASLVALLDISGLGPKAVLKLRAELGVQSLDDLRAAIAARRLRTLKGFGVKSEEKLAAVLARLDAAGAGSRTPIALALPLAERFVARLLEIRGVSHASYAGSLRRFSETVGDVDLVVVASEGAASEVMDAVVHMPVVERVLGRGDAKTSVVTRRGLQIDVRVVAAHQLGAAQLYFTGSKGHNIKLRQRALARGWTLNEYALSELETGKVVASETEEEIYAALGLPWIPPVLREDQGEIEAAEQGTLPRPITRIAGDFHVHTSTSGDAKAPLEDVVAEARARHYAVIAITDHAEGTLAGVDRDTLLAQRARIEALQRQVGDGLQILHGVELNIGPNGELDYDLEFRRQFDFCLASIHDHFDLDVAAQTRRVVTAMRDPTVRMIGHLTARMIGRRPPVSLDLDAIFQAAELTDTALEINGGLPRLDLSVPILQAARGRGVKLVLTSDAHRVRELGRIDHARQNAERAGIDPAQIVNTWSAEALMAWASPQSIERRAARRTST